MEEEYRDIPGYEGLYQVSNLGRVKSLSKYINTGINKGYIKNEMILKEQFNKHTGYNCYGLSINNNKKNINTHLLLSITFLNHTNNKNVVNHIDGNKLNNKLENLEIVTHRENLTTCFRKDKNKHSSQYIGVSWDKSRNKWFSNIKINGFNKTLGRFNTEIEASNAYQNKLKEFLNIK